MSNISYVKFLRGPQSAYARLKKKDPDCLYLVDLDDGNVILYIGDKLIAEGDVSIVSQLANLSDVDLSSTISDNDILVYNSSSESWKNKSLSSFIFTGATENSNGTSGLVPVPKSANGDFNKFLRGDGTWAAASVNPELETTVGQLKNIIFDQTNDSGETTLGLQTIVSNLQSQIGNTNISNLNTSVENLQNIILDSTDSEGNTTLGLQSVVNNLQIKVDNLDPVNLSSRVENLETFLGKETLEDGTTTFIPVFDNYINVNTFETEIGDLSKLLNEEGTPTTIVDEILELKEKTSWNTF